MYYKALMAGTIMERDFMKKLFQQWLSYFLAFLRMCRRLCEQCCSGTKHFVQLCI